MLAIIFQIIMLNVFAFSITAVKHQFLAHRLSILVNRFSV